MVQLSEAAEEGRWDELGSLMQLVVEDTPPHHKPATGTGTGDGSTNGGPYDAALATIERMASQGAQVRSIRTLLRAAVRARRCMHAAHALRWMRARDLEPGVKDYCLVISALLQTAKGSRGKPHAEVAHALWVELSDSGLALDAAALRTGMNTCVMAGRLADAEALFESGADGIGAGDALSEDPDPLRHRAFNILAKGYGMANRVDKLEALLPRMRREGVAPDDATFKSLVGAYVDAGRLDLARACFDDAVSPNGESSRGEGKEMGPSEGAAPAPAHGNGHARRRTHAHAHGGVSSDAKRAMYGALLKGVARQPVGRARRGEGEGKGKGEDSRVVEARALIALMRSEGIEPDAYAYSQLLGLLVDAGDMREAEATFEAMQRAPSSVAPNVFIYNIMLRGYCGERWERTKPLRLLKRMGGEGIRPTTSTFNTLIGAALGVRDNDAASALFRLMVSMEISPDRVTYTKLIKSFGDLRLPEEAMRVFEEMERRGGGADKIAFNCMLAALGKSGRTEECRALYARMTAKDRGLLPDSVTFNTIVRAHCAGVGERGERGREGELRHAVAFTKRAAQRRVRLGMPLYDRTLRLCVRERKFGYAADVLKAMVGAGCGGEEVEAREAFVRRAEAQSKRKEKARRAKGNAIAVERLKWAVGMPNTYYDDLE